MLCTKNLELTIAHTKTHCKWRAGEKSNIDVWFPSMYSQKWNWYFQNRIIMFCFPVPTLIYLWEIYIFPGLVCLFCCREICGPILGIYKSLADTRMWKLGLRPRNSQKRNTKWDFPCSAHHSKIHALLLTHALLLQLSWAGRWSGQVLYSLWPLCFQDTRNIPALYSHILLAYTPMASEI